MLYHTSSTRYTAAMTALIFWMMVGCGKELPPPPSDTVEQTTADTTDTAAPTDTTPSTETSDTDTPVEDTAADDTAPTDTAPIDTATVDTAVTDTGPVTTEDGECVPAGGDWPISSGSYVGSVAQAEYNFCENDVGNGYHIHVGEQNPVGIDATDNCLRADFGGLVLEGGVKTDGTITMTGFLDDPRTSYCTLRIHATLTGTVTDDDTFDYIMAAEVEPLDADCELLVGKGESHTFPSLPCEFSWSGQVWQP